MQQWKYSPICAGAKGRGGGGGDLRRTLRWNNESPRPDYLVATCNVFVIEDATVDDVETDKLYILCRVELFSYKNLHHKKYTLLYFELYYVILYLGNKQSWKIEKKNSSLPQLLSYTIYAPVDDEGCFPSFFFLPRRAADIIISTTSGKGELAPTPPTSHDEITRSLYTFAAQLFALQIFYFSPFSRRALTKSWVRDFFQRLCNSYIDTHTHTTRLNDF